MKLLNQIKAEINKRFEQRQSSVLDYTSFTGISENDLFQILEEYYVKMANNNQIEIDNQLINQYFINKINEQLRALNTKLKNEITQLSNLPFDIVSIGTNNLFLEKLTYNQIIDIIKKLGNDVNYSANNPNPKIFKT